MQCPHCGVLILSDESTRQLEYMRRVAPKRGGFMYEGARPSYEDGSYKNSCLDELLATGAIVPHPDPAKGWIVK